MPLHLLRDIDIQSVDINTLIDAASVSADLNLPVQERMYDVVEQMGGNPYFLRSGDIVVKVSYADTPVSFNERMECYLRTL